MALRLSSGERDRLQELHGAREEMESGVSCMICLDVSTNPVLLDCGHCFCKSHLLAWKERENSCPNCRHTPIRFVEISSKLLRRIEEVMERRRALQLGTGIIPHDQITAFPDQILGSGSFGKVIKGDWQGKIVAIKHLPSLADNAAKLATALKREFELLLRLYHANVTICYGCSFNPTTHATELVMEFARHGSLRKLLSEAPLSGSPASGGPLGWKRFWKFSVDIARGLEYLHAQSVIHRDIKPENVLVFDNDTAKLTDFGLSKSFDSTASGSMGALRGTPAYMAPDSCLVDPVTRKRPLSSSRHDVYSLGLVLLEMLTNTAPFSGEQAMMIMMLLLQQQQPVIPKVVPKDLQAVIGAAMQLDPQQRATATQTLVALKGLADNHDDAIVVIPLPPDSPDFTFIKGIITASAELQTKTDFTVVLENIQIIHSPKVEERFRDYQSQFDSHVTKFLFHGSSIDGLEAIKREGFEMREQKQTVSGEAAASSEEESDDEDKEKMFSATTAPREEDQLSLGVGVYFTNSIAGAAYYSAERGNTKTCFLCEVFVGREKVLLKRQHLKGCPDGFDSAMYHNKRFGWDEHIVFDGRAAVPRYLVQYRRAMVVTIDGAVNAFQRFNHSKANSARYSEAQVDTWCSRVVEHDSEQLENSLMHLGDYCRDCAPARYLLSKKGLWSQVINLIDVGTNDVWIWFALRLCHNFAFEFPDGQSMLMLQGVATACVKRLAEGNSESVIQKAAITLCNVVAEFKGSESEAIAGIEEAMLECLKGQQREQLTVIYLICALGNYMTDWNQEKHLAFLTFIKQFVCQFGIENTFARLPVWFKGFYLCLYNIMRAQSSSHRLEMAKCLTDSLEHLFLVPLQSPNTQEVLSSDFAAPDAFFLAATTLFPCVQTWPFDPVQLYSVMFMPSFFKCDSFRVSDCLFLFANQYSLPGFKEFLLSPQASYMRLSEVLDNESNSIVRSTIAFVLLNYQQKEAWGSWTKSQLQGLAQQLPGLAALGVQGAMPIALQ
eukprot:m.105862 g.105862  ORF g.105862 m.105862 type:complete len:1006 (-) comp13288_c0_seq4:132-3149(-)